MTPSCCNSNLIEQRDGWYRYQPWSKLYIYMRILQMPFFSKVIGLSHMTDEITIIHDSQAVFMYVWILRISTAFLGTVIPIPIIYNLIFIHASLSSCHKKRCFFWMMTLLKANQLPRWDLKYVSPFVAFYSYRPNLPSICSSRLLFGTQA